MEDPRPSQLRDRPDTGEALYTRSSDGSVSDEYAALRESAALVDLSYRKILRLSGKKAVEMLNAVLTNQVPEEDRLGVYALLLNPKGRIQADLRVLKSGEDILIAVEPEEPPQRRSCWAATLPSTA